MPAAVSGQNGHQATFAAAAALVHGFALTEAEAWPILSEHNARCSPPWSEAELRHKLASAQTLSRHPKPKGHLAGEERPRPTRRKARPLVTSIPALFTPPPIEEERPPKIYGVVKMPTYYPTAGFTELREKLSQPPEPPLPTYPATAPSGPVIPADYCPTCWTRWSRALRPGSCYCTALKPIPSSIRGITKS